MTKNPFRFNRPAPPNLFVGRHHLVNQITDELFELDGDSYGIVGGRKFGKSSLLLAIDRSLTSQLHDHSSENLVVLPIYFSLKSIEVTSPSDFFGMALHLLQKATHGEQQSKLFPRPHISLGLPSYTTVNSIPSTLQEFESLVEEIVIKAHENIGILRIALLIDEVDCVLDFEWTDSLFNMLRSMIYDGPVRDYVRFVIAGSGRFLDVDEKGSPLLNAIKPLFLEAFSEEALDELISHAPNLNPDIQIFVKRLGMGHAFILQYLMHHLMNTDQSLITQEAVEIEVNRFFHTRVQDIEGWWYAIGKSGRHIYCILNRSNSWMTRDDIYESVTQEGIEIERGLRALCYHGIAIHDGRYQKYKVSENLFRNWAQHKCAEPKQYEIPLSSIPLQVEAENLSGINRIDSDKLRPIATAIQSHFDREEFRTLCFNIGVNYDSLRPGGLESQTIQLVLWADRASYLDRLLLEVRRLRPNCMI